MIPQIQTRDLRAVEAVWISDHIVRRPRRAAMLRTDRLVPERRDRLIPLTSTLLRIILDFHDAKLKADIQQNSLQALSKI